MALVEVRDLFFRVGASVPGGFFAEHSQFFMDEGINAQYGQARIYT